MITGHGGQLSSFHFNYIDSDAEHISLLLDSWRTDVRLTVQLLILAVTISHVSKS